MVTLIIVQVPILEPCSVYLLYECIDVTRYVYILRYDTASVALAIVKMSICRVTFTVGNYYGMSPEHNFKILLIS